MAFIGRERELAVLGGALQRAADRELTRVAISGHLGIGVTRLLDELEARLAKAKNSGVTVLRARCLEPLAGVAYGALREPLGDAYIGISADRPELDAPDQRGARGRETLLTILERVAGDGQLCLIVEDLEHADPGTRELVRMLLRLRRRMALTLIVAWHGDELGRGHPAEGLVDEIAASEGVERVALEPLNTDELFALVESLEDERPTLGFMAAVMEGSRGNPLVASQLVVAHQHQEGVRLSDPLEEIIHASLAGLDRGVLRGLRLLALSRRPMSTDELASLRLPDGHLPRTALEKLPDSGLVVLGADGALAVHQLVAEAIEHATLPSERHALQSALADAADEPGVAAWHWSRAFQPTRAHDAYLRAAVVSEAIEPGPTTLANYSAALEIDLQGATDPEILASAAAAAYASGAFRHAATLAEQAMERLAGGRVERLLSARADAAVRERAARLSEELGRYRRSSGDLAGAREAIEQAVELAPAGAAATRAMVLASLAQDLMLDGHFTESVKRAEEARTAARSAGDDALFDLAHATDTLAVDLGYSGQVDRALGLLDEAIADARRAGRLDELVRCYANKTTLLDLDTRRDEALAAVKEGIAEAKRNGLGLTYGAFLRGNAADILFQLGRWEESEAECRAGLEFPPAGVAWVSPILYLGLVLVEARADEEAERLLGQTLLQLETVPAGQWSAIVLRTAVSFALWRGELDDAMAAAAQGWERVVESEDAIQMAVSAATVLEACAASAEKARAKRDFSKVADAGALATRVLKAAEDALAAYALPRTVGARREAELYLATARAHAERVKGRSKPETWAAIADEWAQIPVPYNVAKARWWQTVALLPNRSRRAEARKALNEAWKIAGKLPAEPLRRALHELGERGRIRLPEDRLVAIPMAKERELVAVGPGPAQTAAQGSAVREGLAAFIGGDGASRATPPAMSRFGLSPRENSVLAVLAEGRTNREIAERLFISDRTVAVHVRRILSKLGVSGRVEATGLAIRLGLVPDDPRVAAKSKAARR